MAVQQDYINAGGVKSFKLYENKGIALTYTGDTVTSIGASVQTYTFERKYKPTYLRDYNTSSNYLTAFANTVSAVLPKFDLTTSATVQRIKNSYYGWLCEIEFSNGLKVLLLDPLFLDDTTKNINENWFVLTLTDRVSSTKEAVLSNIVDIPLTAILDDDLGALIADDNTIILED